MSKRPHILIFNPDQWRSDVMGHLGNEAAVTPHLDAMVAEEAVSFRHAYCQNPVCTPSRCSFMSGWYPHVSGHRTMTHMLHPELGEPNLLKKLKDAGYFVWWGGKNDLCPGQDGWEAYADVKFRATQEDFARWGFEPQRDFHDKTTWPSWRGEQGGDNYYSFHVGKVEPAEGNAFYGHGDWASVHGAIDFIRERGEAAEDQPVVIFLALSYPHPPYAEGDPYYSMIDPDRLPPRIPSPESWEGKPSLLRGLAEKQGLTDWDESRWDDLRRTYYAMCARVDHQFGLVRQAMIDAEMWDETACFFFSDHGDFTGDYGLVEKTQNTFEDCLTRVPLIIKPPASHPVQPRVTEAMAELIDFTATCYDYAGVGAGYDHFGQSLAEVIVGETDEHRDAVFCEGGRRMGEMQASELVLNRTLDPKNLYFPRQSLQTNDEQPYHSKAAMCRTDRFKYVMRLYEQDELYDLRSDPCELHNRSADPDYRDVLHTLRQRLLTWYMQTCDVVPMEMDQRNFG